MSAFSFVIPLQKNSALTLQGIASATTVDRDEERMSLNALKNMVRDIKIQGVNLFQDHKHDWKDTLGFVKNAELTADEKVSIDINLDDPTTNAYIPMLLNKLKRGIRLGLSVGGNVISKKYEYDPVLKKKITILDDVKVYEVSVVGIASNADSYLNIPQSIAKSYRENSFLKCFNCWHESSSTVCSVCFTPLV